MIFLFSQLKRSENAWVRPSGKAKELAPEDLKSEVSCFERCCCCCCCCCFDDDDDDGGGGGGGGDDDGGGSGGGVDYVVLFSQVGSFREK